MKLGILVLVYFSFARGQQPGFEHGEGARHSEEGREDAQLSTSPLPAGVNLNWDDSCGHYFNESKIDWEILGTKFSVHCTEITFPVNYLAKEGYNFTAPIFRLRPKTVTDQANGVIFAQDDLGRGSVAVQLAYMSSQGHQSVLNDDILFEVATVGQLDVILFDKRNVCPLQCCSLTNFRLDKVSRGLRAISRQWIVRKLVYSRNTVSYIQTTRPMRLSTALYGHQILYL